MIDFHTHILPGIDDGSHNLDESIALVKRENIQQVTDIVFTPHFYADKVSFQNFLERREKSCHKLISALSNQNIIFPQIHVGAEVFYFGSIGKAEALPQLCIKNTNVLLLEMPFCQWTEDMLQNIKQIIYKQKLQIMLAHVERYLPFQKDKKVMEAVFDMPVILQLNAGSLMKWQKRHKCMNLLKRDLDIVLGSDCHNLENRVPNIAEGRAVIANTLGTQYLDYIDALGERCLRA